MPPRYTADLIAAVFTTMSVANNYPGDFGDARRASTRTNLDQQGVKFVGSDRGQFATTVLTIRGIRVGFVGFAHNDVVPNVNDQALRVNSYRS